MTLQHNSGHEPRRDKIPASLQSLNWHLNQNDPDFDWFYDGDRILAAVPVRNKRIDPNTWQYEFSVVTVRCDEHYFALEVEGEPWGWDLDCIDWYVRIK